MHINDDHNSDGSENFWPGYVDAVTNLVLNLLFLLTIMTVAVFMFALELGRASLGGAGKTPVAAPKEEVVPAHKPSADPVKERAAVVAALQQQVRELSRETPANSETLKKRVDAINEALKQEIQLLNLLQAQRAPLNLQPGTHVRVVPATSTVPQPQKGLDKSLAADAEVIVRFTDDAVTLKPAEDRQLREALKSVVARGKAQLYVEVPSGFSESKRMGFYRAMAVRNILIEMKMPKERIEVSVREGESHANASLVRVSSQ